MVSAALPSSYSKDDVPMHESPELDWYEFRLPTGETVKIDHGDRALAATIPWCRMVRPQATYVQSSKKPKVLLHRLLMDVVHAGRAVHVDHINGDGLDNRRANLRVCTARQNQGNSRRRIDNTSGYRGVTRQVITGKWLARIRFGLPYGGTRMCHLGTFASPESAARAYDRAACAVRGEFSQGQDEALNYPAEHTPGCCAEAPDALVRKALRIQAETYAS